MIGDYKEILKQLSEILSANNQEITSKKRKSDQIDLNNKNFKIQKHDEWFSCTSCLKIMEDYVTINDECVH